MNKIMLVDDVEISNFIVKKMLNKISKELLISDFTLPVEAMKALEDIDPDLIFLDLNMPEMDGWKFLDTMRERNLKHKVYILTSSTSQIDLQHSKAYENVVGLLTKPLNAQTLQNILAEMAPVATVA